MEANTHAAGYRSTTHQGWARLATKEVTMAAKYEWHYTVYGNSYVFPFDMLRYDACHPRRELDSGVMERMARQRTPGIDYEVQIAGLVAPTEGRWASFGWRVKDVSKVRVA